MGLFLFFFIISIVFSMAIFCIFNKTRFALELPSGERSGCIDGLRGYLALMVAGHHYYIFYYWMQSGDWNYPDIALVNNMGRVGVSVFFMITGFLFISKLISDKEKSRKINWVKLYNSRFFRIMPLYLFSVISTILIAFYATDFHMNVSFPTLLKEVFKWLLFLGGDINGYSDTRHITAGVTWTLKYEWLFYISLPIIAVFMNFNKGIVFLALFVSYIAFQNIIVRGSESKHLLFFVYGGGVAYLKFWGSSALYKTIKMRSLSIIPIASLIVVLTSYDDASTIINSILLLIFFSFIALGNDLLGFLRLSSSINLGEVSYSLYLNHGICLFLLYKIVAPMLVMNGSVYFMMLMPITFVFIVCSSIITYKVIERPFISMGKNLFKK
jgi:peptidoglycan/LPS O-acetylase OafA/YrhL